MSNLLWSSTSTICVSWDRFSDPHTGISLYQWSAGTSPGSDNIISERNLTDAEVTERRACMNGLTLSNGVSYYSTIVAYNGAEERLSTTVTSDGGNLHSLTHSLTHSLARSLAHSLTHSLTHPPTRSLTHTLTHTLTHSHTHPHTHSPTPSPSHSHY